MCSGVFYILVYEVISERLYKSRCLCVYRGALHVCLCRYSTTLYGCECAKGVLSYFS